MIALQKRLYESLLDDEEELVSNDETINEIQFYKELQTMLPNHEVERIKQECKYNKGKANLDSTFQVSSKNKTSDEYGDNIFKGFSVCSEIERIRCIDILKYYDTKNIDPNKYSVSKINKYPMNIKKLMWFGIYSAHLLDYCKSINIDYIDRLFFFIDKDTPELKPLYFEFFKNVKNIEHVSINNHAQTLMGKGEIIPAGVIRNINANSIDIHINNIVQGVTNKTELNKDNIIIFNEFIDNLYKYNNINKIIISTHNIGKMGEKKYIIEKGKTKSNKYVLKPLK